MSHCAVCRTLEERATSMARRFSKLPKQHREENRDFYRKAYNILLSGVDQHWKSTSHYVDTSDTLVAVLR